MRRSEGAPHPAIPPPHAAHDTPCTPHRDERMDPILPGLTPSPAVLFDERVRPDFRDVFGTFASRAVDIATAMGRVRLSAVDLTRLDLDRLQSFRVLVSELNAIQLDGEAVAIQADPTKAPRVEVLRVMLESGKLEVRAAPLGGWSPDFTVFSEADGPAALLSGYHWFERPYPHRGPALASLHRGDAARLAARRHHELWERAHDVGPAVWNILSKARRAARLITASGA